MEECQANVYQDPLALALAVVSLPSACHAGAARSNSNRALNNFARATGEALREKVYLAMPDAVLDMCFAHYLEDFADD